MYAVGKFFQLKIGEEYDDIIQVCSHIIPDLAQGQTGVKKLIFLYFGLYLEKYDLESYKAPFYNSARLFRPINLVV